MSQVQFVIEKNIPIPKREVEFGPRGSQYPIEQMEVGDSFRVKIVGATDATDKDGNPLSVAEDAKKKASQKQSYFSALGRKLGVKVATRYFAEDAEYGPHLRVWHDGPRTAEDDASEVELDEQAAAGDIDLD
jgi:hypothetical protein